MTKSTYPKKGARPRPQGDSRKAAEAARSRQRMKARILGNTARISVIDTHLELLMQEVKSLITGEEE